MRLVDRKLNFLKVVLLNFLDPIYTCI